MVRFDSDKHYSNWERFLAVARNDKRNNDPVISNEESDLSPNCTAAWARASQQPPRHEYCGSAISRWRL
jgi:hypothetical protein